MDGVAHCPCTGIKPVYVFDGKPPELKVNHELAHRAARREETAVALAAAKEANDQDAIEKYSKRSTRVGCHGRGAGPFRPSI